MSLENSNKSKYVSSTSLQQGPAPRSREGRNSSLCENTKELFHCSPLEYQLKMRRLNAKKIRCAANHCDDFKLAAHIQMDDEEGPCHSRIICADSTYCTFTKLPQSFIIHIKARKRQRLCSLVTIRFLFKIFENYLCFTLFHRFCEYQILFIARHALP